MNFMSELEALLAQQGSPEFVSKVRAMARPGIHLQKRFQTISTEQSPLLGLFKRKPKLIKRGLAVTTGASRLGGLPELPVGQPWPHAEGRPMQFLAQINCAELAEFREFTLLPADGTLHFFFERDGSESKVIFTPRDVQLAAAAAPTGADAKGFVMPQFPVEFVPIPTFPHYDTQQFEPLNANDQEAEAFLEAHAAWAKKYLGTQYDESGGLHQIGGYPQAIQGDVLTECEMIGSGNYPNTDAELWKRASGNAHQWRLLLQFDTDDDMDVMWGDAGMVYFCIREGDLRVKRFDKVCSTGQCG